MALDGITLRSLVHEMKSKLVNGKIDKITQPEKDEIWLTIRNEKQNHKLLISANSSTPRIHFVNDAKKENPLTAPMFLMLLRKHIGNGTIKSVEQRSTERIVEISIDAYDELRVLKNKTLIIELMGKHSNIILVHTEDRKIIDSIKRVSLNISSVREVLPGLTYQYPPGHKKISPIHRLDEDEFRRLCSNFHSEIYKLFYMSYEGMSPTISKEICYRANVESTEVASSLSEVKTEKLWGTFSRMMSRIEQHEYSPCIVIQRNPHTILDFSAVLLTHYETMELVEYQSIHTACEEFYFLKDRAERIQQRTSALRKKIQTRLDTLQHKTEKQNNEISSSMLLDKDKLYGELLTSYIYQIKTGMSEITLENFYSSNEKITIPLDVQKSPSENIQRYFKRYQKSKNRIEELTEQLAIAQKEISYLENVLLSISQIETYDEISEIQDELAKQGYIRRMGNHKSKKETISSPMEFTSSDGTTILVGKNNTQNDRLTLKLSSPNDTWLHTKDIPGSHVIIRAKQQDISEKTLYEAAVLAAYYSKGKFSSNVPVDYTERKNVKKPSGAKPGMVIYVNNSTIYVTPEESVVEQLKTHTTE
ncbi:fibronectin-binding protein [Filifactor alocis ATCC 35896]|uniref:Rqc2 homolog RqcH n=1 Tax=Filifactor alocis (strain ATCC 35896 / CCUG 47790 / D40 B5) TaxID=546269 RepID=D6GSL7_FILAD|nr:NFACT RNA binding domain-containing protein [Filifactor alocis]EFE28658.1 fibronectin-binding protein [Filifactor alocis ATCC 35896]